MKKNIIFDLVGVIFSINKYAALKNLGVWRTFIFYCKHGVNPFDFILSLLDKIRKTVPGEYQDKVHLKGIYLPKSMCRWQEGHLSTHQVCKKMLVYLDHIIRDYNMNKEDRRMLERLCSIIFDSVLQAKILKPISSTVNVLHVLKKDPKIRLFMLTNIDKETFSNLLHRYPEIFGLFEGIVTSYETGLVKPDPEIYKILLERYSINTTTACYIDDQEDNVAVAQQFGIRTILFCSKINLENDVQKFLAHID